MREVVIVEAARTAVGRKNGTLARTHPLDMLGPVQSAVLDRARVDPGSVGQVVGGCIDQVGAQSGNVTRNAWLAAGLPQAVACTTVDSAFGSSHRPTGALWSAFCTSQALINRSRVLVWMLGWSNAPARSRVE